MPVFLIFHLFRHCNNLRKRKDQNEKNCDQAAPLGSFSGERDCSLILDLQVCVYQMGVVSVKKWVSVKDRV